MPAGKYLKLKIKVPPTYDGFKVRKFKIQTQKKGGQEKCLILD
jgi:hypothetical protein